MYSEEYVFVEGAFIDSVRRCILMDVLSVSDWSASQSVSQSVNRSTGQ